MISKNEISFSASYLFGTEDASPLLQYKKVGRPYCPFTLWLDSDLALFVLDNDNYITSKIPKFILWDDDWTVIKNSISQNKIIQNLK